MNASLPEQWLQKASEDLAAARLLFPEQLYSLVCFHAQQCIEKAFKGFILTQTNIYPRTHKLEDLQFRCEAIDPDFAQFINDCLIVDQYYIPTRYPDSVPGTLPSGPPNEQEAQEALEIADRIFRFVQEKLIPLDNGSAT